MANNIIERIWNQNVVGTIEDLSGSAFQAEAGAHTFVISGVDNAGAAVALSGTVAGVFMKPDNTDVALTGSISNGKASVTLTAECYTVPGRFGLTIFVTSGGVKTAVYAAVGTVSRTNTGNVSASAEADVVDLINRINAAVATVPASWTGLMADIAPTYSASAVYPVGAYVYYNGDLYRCTTAITTAESWTPAHWTAAVMGDDVSSLKSALDTVEQKIFGDEPYSKANNTYNPNSGNEGNGYPAGTYGVGKCSFDVTAYRGKKVGLFGAQFGWVMQFSDTIGSSNYISYTKFNANKSTVVFLTVAANAKYVAVNVWDSNSGATLADMDTFLSVAEAVNDMIPVVDDFEKRVDGITAVYTSSSTYNPNSGNEGNGYPAGTYGVGRCLFDISAYVGKQVTIVGAQYGWFMQFTDEPAPGYFISGTKVDIGQATDYTFTVATNAKYAAVNVWDSTANAIMLAPDGFVLRDDLPQMGYYDKNNCTFVAIGDSITHGAGASTYSKCYFTLLARKLEAARITNARYEVGLSGGGSTMVAANVGAVENVITGDVTIPAATTAIEIGLDIPIYDAGRNLVKTNPCYLNGIVGSLSKTSSGSNYYFTRTEAGSAKFTPAGTALITNSCKTTNNAKIAVIFVGTNDGLNSHPENIDITLANIKAIASQIKTKRFVVVAPYVNSTSSTFREKLGEIYGQRFFDLYNYFSKQGVLDAIAEDLLDSGDQDDWLSLLTTDGVHLNDAGHQLIAERLFERMDQIGLLA